MEVLSRSVGFGLLVVTQTAPLPCTYRILCCLFLLPCDWIPSLLVLSRNVTETLDLYICELRPPVTSRPHNDRQSAHKDTPQKAPIAELRPAPPLALYEGVSCRANVLKQLLVQPTASCAKVTSMRGTVLMGKTVSHMSLGQPLRRFFCRGVRPSPRTRPACRNPSCLNTLVHVKAAHLHPEVGERKIEHVVAIPIVA